MSEKVFAPRLARRTFLAASAASAALMLTGCLNLAPRYEKPAAPTETSQDWAVSPRDAGVKEGELVTWDKFFLDERLRKVIELALANNRDLRQSMLEVERLRALYRVSRAELFPTVGAQASATQSRSSIDAIQPGYPRHSHVYAANLAMSSYEIDFFGKIRNMNEQALQAFFAGEDARRSAQNTLIAEVATEWLSIGADQANLDLARRTLESQTASYGLVEKSYNAGASNRLELNQAKETVATGEDRRSDGDREPRAGPERAASPRGSRSACRSPSEEDRARRDAARHDAGRTPLAGAAAPSGHFVR